MNSLIVPTISALILSLVPSAYPKTENFWFKSHQSARKFALVNNDGKFLQRCLRLKGADTSGCKNGVFRTKICKYNFNRQTRETELSVKTDFKDEYHTQVFLKSAGQRFCKIVVDLDSKHNRYCGEIALYKSGKNIGRQCDKKYFITQISSGRYRVRNGGGVLAEIRQKTPTIKHTIAQTMVPEILPPTVTPKYTQNARITIPFILERDDM